MSLGSMVYKSFAWYNNPSRCSIECERSFVVHKYPDLNGVDIDDMGVNVSIISGEGEFFGATAYLDWHKLYNVYLEGGAGSFYHPIYRDVSMGMMTKLKSSLEPREDYIAYTFEIVAFNPITEEAYVSPQIIDIATDNDYEISVGDTVICNGRARSSSYGAMPESYLMSNAKMTVTYTNYKSGATHPIHVGSVGWISLDNVKFSNSGVAEVSTPKSLPVETPVETRAPVAGSNDIVYTMKSGDTLQSVCTRYGVDWKTVAVYNNIKNPNKMNIGDSFIITRALTQNKFDGAKNDTYGAMAGRLFTPYGG